MSGPSIPQPIIAVTDDGVALRVVADPPSGLPALVFAHALGADASMWEPQETAFSERFRVVHYDHRGHGRSGVPAGPATIARLGKDAVTVLDSLGIDRATFCGASLGGLVGLWLAANRPERIAALVVAGALPAMPPPSMWDERIATVRRDGLAAIVEPTLLRWFTLAFHAAAPAVVDQVRQVFLGTAVEGYAACCAALRDADLTEAAATIACPTLILAGEHDPTAPPAKCAALAEAIPGARFATVPGAGHLFSVEAADRFDAAVLAFLDAALTEPAPAQPPPPRPEPHK